MKDFYTTENLKNRINKINFLELQRVIYPILSEDKMDGNSVSKLLVENYYTRLMRNEIDIQNFDIDKWLSECASDRLDQFVRIVNSGIISKSFDDYDYNDIKYTMREINRSINHSYIFTTPDKVIVDYLGSKFQTSTFSSNLRDDNATPYIHYNYDNKIKHILSVLGEKADIRYVSEFLSKYGLDNFEELSYSDIDTLLTAIISRWDFENVSSELIVKISNILKAYDKKDVYYSLDKLDLKYLSDDKLRRLCRALDLSLKLMDEAAFRLMYESEIDVDLCDMYNANALNLMNDEDTISNAYNLVCEEIQSRRESHFNRDALYYANRISNDLDKGRSKKLKIWFFMSFLYIFLFICSLCYWRRWLHEYKY